MQLSGVLTSHLHAFFRDSSNSLGGNFPELQTLPSCCQCFQWLNSVRLVRCWANVPTAQCADSRLLFCCRACWTIRQATVLALLQLQRPLSSPAPAAPSMPSSFPDAEAPLRAPYSSDEELNDWPILREGEGGKLVNLPALNLLTCCPHAFYTSIRSTGASDTEGVARDADAGRRIVDQEGVCVIGAPPASSAEPARVLLRGG